MRSLGSDVVRGAAMLDKGIAVCRSDFRILQTLLLIVSASAFVSAIAKLCHHVCQYSGFLPDLVTSLSTILMRRHVGAF